jgi:alpha/beta superfamily hydrolase
VKSYRVSYRYSSSATSATDTIAESITPDAAHFFVGRVRAFATFVASLPLV